jgi:uncharacterized ferritin-like protein (DUF455 family)
MILESPRLEDKLTPLDLASIDFLLGDDSLNQEPVLVPGREPRIQMSDEKSKIPRLEHLNESRNIAISFHHFANHELMAIELFAYGVLKFPSAPKGAIRGFLRSLMDEQEHFKMYQSRMNHLGVGFGDKPLNKLFWKQIGKMQTLEKFVAVMSISFEGANLDYTRVYKKAFDFHGDIESAKIMEKIYIDEIKHVKRGLAIFKGLKPNNLSEWEYYISLLEYPFTPRRAKGYLYFPETRIKAGLGDDFARSLGEYEDIYTGRVNRASLEKVGL